MGLADTSGPVIVMIEAGDGEERENIHRWFESSRFSVFDAVNIFDALEVMTDFTVRDRHDVVLLNVDNCDADLPMIRTTFAAVANDACPEFMGVTNNFANSVRSSCYKGDLEHVAAKLDRLIPDRSPSVN